jgi:hypothetical protein
MRASKPSRNNAGCLAICLTAVFASSGCGGQTHDEASTAMTADHLVGAWRFTGRVPASVALTLDFRQDNTFLFEEQIAPSSFPAGLVPNTSCITTDSYEGTYTVEGGSDL